MQPVTKQTLKIFWQHMVLYKKSTILILTTLVIASVINVLEPVLVKMLLNAVVMENPQGREQALRIVWYIFAVGLGYHILQRVRDYTITYLQPRVMSDLLNTCYKYMLGHSYGFFTNNFAGSIVTKARRFHFAFERITDVYFYELVPTVLTIMIMVGVLFDLNTYFGVIALIWWVASMIFILATQRYRLPFDIAMTEQDSRTTGHLADTISNIMNLKVFTSMESENKKFQQITEDLRLKRTKAWSLGNHFSVVFGSMTISFKLLVLYSAVNMYRSGTLTLGDFALLVGFLAQIFERMWNLSRSLRYLYEGLADANEMTQMLMLDQEIKDAADAPALAVTKGNVVFENVGFQYKHNTKIFHGFNLSIRPGEKLALVGPSGGGKSTCIKLLFRFKDIQEGRILIDEQDISKVTQDSVRQAVALVPQEPILFHRSLMDNIRYGRPSATDEEVYAAAKAAHAHEFITKLPEGYKTFVGERGVKLSGGERQRVAIAMAILKNAPILVLDEATSSLDSESEYLIQDALSNLMKGKTTIVIAHRLSTIREMDRIIVMEDGQVKEEGTHEQLLSRDEGLYQRLWQRQVNGFVSV